MAWNHYFHHGVDEMTVTKTQHWTRLFQLIFYTWKGKHLHSATRSEVKCPLTSIKDLALNLWTFRIGLGVLIHLRARCLLKFMPSIYDCCRPWRNSVSRERSQPASRRRWRGDMYPGLGTASSAEVSAALSRMTREILFTSPWITWLFYSTNMANKRYQNRSIW